MTDQPGADVNQAASSQDGAEVNRGHDKSRDRAGTHPTGTGQCTRQLNSDQVGGQGLGHCGQGQNQSVIVYACMPRVMSGATERCACFPVEFYTLNLD